MTAAEDFAAILPKLMEMYPASWSMRLRDEHRQIGHVAHGWYMRVHRGIEAMLLLDEDGFGAEAAPLRRSIIEHVVGLQWLAKEGDVVRDALISGAAHDAERRKESLKAAGWTFVDWEAFDTVIADREGRDRSRNHELHFRQRCEKAGDQHDLAAWMTETAHSHPCWQSAATYLDYDAETHGITLRGIGRSDVDATSFAVIHLFQALTALNAIVRGKPYNKRLASLGHAIKAAVVKHREAPGLAIPDVLLDRA